MNKVDVSKELVFKTARSGGKGGQNVNKVETMVEVYFNIQASALLTEEEKQRVTEKLFNKVNSEGFLLVKSQTERTQLGNKHEAVKKINDLISRALIVPLKRKASKPSAASKRKRVEQKKLNSKVKEGRKKVRYDE